MPNYLLGAVFGLGMLGFTFGNTYAFGPGPTTGHQGLQSQYQRQKCDNSRTCDQLRLMTQDQLRLRIAW